MPVLNRKQRLTLMEMVFNLDAEIAAYDYAICNLLYQQRRDVPPMNRVNKKKRAFWVRPWLQKRPYIGQYKLVMDDLRLTDVTAFKNFTRMDPQMFFALLDKLRPRIEKFDTKWRQAIKPGVRLALALRFFATGDSYKSLSYAWLIAHNTISKIVREVAEAIIAEFSEEELSPPVTPEGWKEIAEKFETRWNFPHAIGAIDGKHIAIRCPKQSGSNYYNYKGFYSIVMLAIVDADYKFIWVDAGANGACSDAQIWNSCEFLESVEAQELGIPEATPLVEGERAIPYCIIGDDAFALRTFLLKPFSRRKMENPERIFNYRLSRARRIVENAFGILANRFRCLLTRLSLNPDTCTSVVLACCCLHNLLRKQTTGYLRGMVDVEDQDHELIPGPWRQNAVLVDGRKGNAKNTGSQEAKTNRDYLRDHFMSPEGSVPWQQRMITLNARTK